MAGLPPPVPYGGSLMTETNYYKSLRKLLMPRIYAWKINDRFTNGVPDWYASGTKKDCWIENKRVYNDRVPQAKEIDLCDPDKYLTVNQREWLIDRHHEGRNVGVLLFSPIGHVFYPGLSWQVPIRPEEFLHDALDRKTMAEQLIDMLGERVLH